MADTLNVYDNSEARTPTLIVETYDARGNGDGVVANTIAGDHQNHATVQTNGVSTALPASMGEGGGYTPMITDKGQTEMIVRRLTPLECERLQGFPDNWTDIGEWMDSNGKKHKEADSPRYKALGNSIALPFWDWLAGRICSQYEKPVEMASLFDGIGGFPLVFQNHGGKAVWASEIEEFPIAVTKRRFAERTNEHI